MVPFVVIVIIFVVMFAVPTIGCIISYRLSKVDVLNINPDYEKDPRFFAKSFSRLIRRALEDYDGGDELVLHRPERVIFARGEELPRTCRELVVSPSGDFDSNEGDPWVLAHELRLREARERGRIDPDDLEDAPRRTFDREIYANGNAILRYGSEARAIYANRSLSIEGDCAIDRWLDAEGVVVVYDDCDLGTSASSAIHLIIGRNCHFRRLYAPKVDIGCYPDDPFESVPLKRHPFVSRGVVWGKYVIDEGDTEDEGYESDPENPGQDLSPVDNGLVIGSVITDHSLKVTEGLFIAGSIRSHHSIRIGDGTIVCGNIFAEGDISLGRRCRVLGSVFTQGDVYVDDDVEIGVEGQIRSVIARGHVRFANRARINGYVNAEHGGDVCLDRVTGQSPDDRPKRLTMVLAPETPQLFTVYPTVMETEDPSFAYRRDPRVRAVHIAAGTEHITRSMFFGCENLTEIFLPPSVKSIGAFAFSGCKSLRRLNLSSCVNLREIRESAFEGCENLISVALPSSVEVLGTAAFLGCGKLASVAIPVQSKLHEIGSHCFKDCVSIQRMRLPQSLEVLGTSAFYGCSSLTGLHLPDNQDMEIGSFAIAGCVHCAIFQVPRPLDESEERGIPETCEVVVSPAWWRAQGEPVPPNVSMWPEPSPEVMDEEEPSYEVPVGSMGSRR